MTSLEPVASCGELAVEMAANDSRHDLHDPRAVLQALYPLVHSDDGRLTYRHQSSRREGVPRAHQVGLAVQTLYIEHRTEEDMRRLQVLTPLSLLVNIATLMTCRFILNPNLGE